MRDEKKPMYHINSNHRQRRVGVESSRVGQNLEVEISNFCCVVERVSDTHWQHCRSAVSACAEKGPSLDRMDFLVSS